MNKKKLYYIGERYNPQFKTPYYVAFGKLTKTEAKRNEQCLYGEMYLNSYEDEQSYNDKLTELKNKKLTVYTI
jgi:hypothetical protein